MEDQDSSFFQFLMQLFRYCRNHNRKYFSGGHKLEDLFEVTRNKIEGNSQKQPENSETAMETGRRKRSFTLPEEESDDEKLKDALDSLRKSLREP